MKKLSLVFIGLLVFIGTYSVNAQTATPSQIRDAVQKKVQEELSSIKQDVAKKGFVGTITAKTDSTLTLNNLKNETRTILVTGETTIKLLNGSEGTPTDLKVNDFIISMGGVDSQNKMTSTRLLVTKQSETDKRDTFFGTVTKTSTTSYTITNLKNETWTIKVSSTTDITDAKLVKIKLADVKVGAKIIVVGTVSSGNNLTSSAVHVL